MVRPSPRATPRRGNIDTTRIEKCHAELAEAMERRDMNHDSPLEYDEPEFGADDISLDRNRADLLER